jgi:hypothetical protein
MQEKPVVKTVALMDMDLHQRVKIFCAKRKLTLIEVVHAALTQYIRQEGAK